MKNLTRWLRRHNPFRKRVDLDAEIAQVETMLAAMYARQPFAVASGLIDWQQTQATIRKAERLLALLYHMRDERAKASH